MWVGGCLALGVAAAGLAGCSSGSSSSPKLAGADPVRAPSVAVEASDPLLRLVGSMPVRTGQSFQEPATGEVLKVEVVRAYDAASGRLCREYQVTDAKGFARQAVACRVGDRWTNARPLRLEEGTPGGSRVQ
jgi:hypothetical protein